MTTPNYNYTTGEGFDWSAQSVEAVLVVHDLVPHPPGFTEVDCAKEESCGHHTGDDQQGVH